MCTRGGQGGVLKRKKGAWGYLKKKNVRGGELECTSQRVPLHKLHLGRQVAANI